MQKLPKYSNEKKTGNIAADILKSVLQRFAMVNSHDESIDIGIDMRAQIFENNRPKELFFNIQCKGKGEVNETDIKDNFFKVQIRVATLNYWMQQNEPTFLFVIDNETTNCYWCCPVIQLIPRLSEIQKQETVIVKIPYENYINSFSEKLPKEFEENIMLYLFHNMSKISKITDDIKSNIIDSNNLNIEFSFKLLTILSSKMDVIQNDYHEITKILINSIEKGISETLSYLSYVDQIDLTRNYCPEGVHNCTSFSKSKKSILQMQKETEDLISNFDFQNIDVSKIKCLENIYRGIEYTMCNAVGFLYEMVCEDRPFSNHDELLLKRDEIFKKHLH